MKDDPGLVYLLCFDERFGKCAPGQQVGHYTGFALVSDFAARMKRHASGTSDVNVINVAHRLGISFKITRVEHGTWEREQSFKNRGGAARRCPRCSGVRPRGQLPQYLTWTPEKGNTIMNGNDERDHAEELSSGVLLEAGDGEAPEQISEDEMASLVRETMLMAYGASTAPGPVLPTHSFTMTTPATGQRFQVSVTEIR